MIILGVESSCDETSASIVDSNKNILSNIVFSQINNHKQFGGVVPEVAARVHAEAIFYTLKKALTISNIKLEDINAIAATCGPGLIGGLMVGINTAQALALSLNKPFIAVNHLEGHLLTARLIKNIPFPFLALLISGGHSQFVIAEGIQKYNIIGTTLDDAIGEAFDKTARLLGLDYPGGKLIEERAKLGDSSRFKFKAPLIRRNNCDFSFSGLKTAVKLLVEKLLKQNQLLTPKDVNDISKCFQETIVEIINNKTILAIKEFEKKYHTLENFVVSGGVAANIEIRKNLENIIKNNGSNFIAPPLELCGDNAAMIAWAGIEKLQLNITNSLNTKAKPSWKLTDF